MAVRTSMKLSRAFRLSRDNLSCQGPADRVQDAWVQVLKYSNGQTSYAKRNIFWGVLNSIKKGQRIRANEAELRYKNDNKERDEHRDWWKSIVSELPDTKKTQAYLADCRDTFVVLAQKAHLGAGEIELFSRHYAYGETLQSLGDEFKITRQAMEQRLKKMSDNMYKIAKERNIPNPILEN